MKLTQSQLRRIIREEIGVRYSDEEMEKALQNIVDSIEVALSIADRPGHSFNPEPLDRMKSSIEEYLKTGNFGDMSPAAPPEWDY
jgi:hypothetical protein